MAGTHEGYSLGIKANYAQVEEAKKATTALYSALGDVEHRAKNLHMGATLPREINHIDTVTASYIRRLESEGKTYEANKQKVSAYQGAIAELSKKQNELKGALEQSKGATDKGSAAYRTQRIRINENVAEINRYKAGLKSANEQMHQANPNFWDKVKSHLHATNTEAEKTHRTFKEVFAGSFLGNAVSNGLSNIGSGLKNAYEEGMNLNLAVAKINGRFKGMGMSAKQTQSLDKQLSNLKANTTMTGDNVADLQSHMLNWSAIGTKGAMQMAKTISGVGDSSKLTGDQIEHVSASLQRVGANGKVTYSSLSRINKAAPTFMAQLAKGAGMSQSKMIALLKTGKVTQTQFQGWMADASKYSSTAFKGFGKTQAGALKQMQVARQKLEQQFTKPIFNAKTSGLQALKNIMTSKTVMSGANQLGKAISNGIGFLDKHKSDLVGITKNVISFGVAIGKATWKDFAAIIQNIGKSLGIIHGNGKKSGSALHTLKLATDGLAKNKTAVQWVAKAIIAMAAIKGLKAVTNPLVDLGTKGVHTFQVVRGISRGLRGITDAEKIKNMGKLETHFFNIGKGARSAAKGIKKATGWLGKKLFSGDKSLLSKATTLGGKIGNSITKAVVASTKFSMGKRLAVGALAGAAVATPEVINAVKDRHSADKRSQDIGGAVGAVAGGALTSMIPVVGPMLAPVGAIIGKYAGRWGGVAVNKFTKGWQANKPPKNFWSLENLGYSAHNMWNGFTKGVTSTIKWFKSNWKEVALYFISPLAGAINSLYKHNRGFHKWVNGLARGFRNGVKGVTAWFKNIPSNIGKTGAKIKAWAGRVGTNIHKGWNKGIKASHNFFKNLPRNMSKFGKSMQRKWNGTWKAVNSNRYVKAFKKGQFMQTAVKDIQSRWHSFSKSFSKSWSSHWNATKRFASKSWNATKRNASKTWANIQSGWNSFSKKFSKSWSSAWQGINNNRYVKAFKHGDLMSTFVKDTQSRWRAFSTDFGKKWNDFWGGLSKGWNKFWGGMGDWAKKRSNNIKAFGNDLDDARGGSGKAFKYTKIKGHARGGLIHTTHGSLVGEAGPELAYKPYANHVRLLGANGPELTKVHSGEHILNAHDTARVIGGGLGHGMVLNGYANGTEKLGKTKKTVTDDYKQIADKSSKSLNKLSKKSKNTWSAITQSTGKEANKTQKMGIVHYSEMRTGVYKQMDKMLNDSHKQMGQMRTGVYKQMDKMLNSAHKQMGQMRTGVHNQMEKMHDGVISLSESTAKGFGKALGKTKGFAQGAMKDTIGVINKGISGIDKVLGQFGGNTSVIKPVKFATGTDSNGRLTRDTYAMVNDATNGPRQEALVSDKNEIFMPHGNNVKMMIPKGWGILNGAQTLQAGLQHFAQGSGLSHSLLRKLAEKAGANPVRSFKDMFLSHLIPSKTDLGRGSTNLASNSGKHFGNPWSAAMWSVINNAIGGGAGKGGTREAFLKYAESTFSGVPYLMGAMSKSVSDCSGMIAQALKHFGLNAGRSTVDMQHSSSLDYLGKNLSNTIPGDLVIFGHGTGAAGHVGIVKNPQTGTMFNETPPHARVTRISDDTGMGYGFYRVKGLHNANASKKTVKSSKRLETLAKRELGSSALKWIKDKLGDEGLLGGNIGGEGVKRWGGTVKRILGMLHLSTSASMVDRVLRQINTESGGNPNARQAGADPDGDGSGPALGLMQTKRTTFNAFKRKGSGGIFNGPADIYAGLNYAKHRYGPSLLALGNGHGYAKGGKPTARTPFIAGEHGPELITADGPVKVDTHEQTKHKLSDLVNIVRSPKINRPTHTSKQAPIININFNGPIGGSVKDAKRIAEIVKREITKYLINIGDEFGTDPSLY